MSSLIVRLAPVVTAINTNKYNLFHLDVLQASSKLLCSLSDKNRSLAGFSENDDTASPLTGLLI